MKENFFCKLKNDYPSEEEIERTKKIFQFLNIKKGEELPRLYLKSNVHYLHVFLRNL